MLWQGINNLLPNYRTFPLRYYRCEGRIILNLWACKHIEIGERLTRISEQHPVFNNIFSYLNFKHGSVHLSELLWFNYAGFSEWCMFQEIRGLPGRETEWCHSSSADQDQIYKLMLAILQKQYRSASSVGG